MSNDVQNKKCKNNRNDDKKSFQDIPILILQEYIFPCLDRQSWNNLAQCNKEIYRATKTDDTTLNLPPWPIKFLNHSTKKITVRYSSVCISPYGEFIVATRFKCINVWHVRFGLIGQLKYPERPAPTNKLSSFRPKFNDNDSCKPNRHEFMIGSSKNIHLYLIIPVSGNRNNDENVGNNDNNHHHHFIVVPSTIIPYDTPDQDTILCHSWSNDGKLLAVGSNNGILRLWEFGPDPDKSTKLEENSKLVYNEKISSRISVLCFAPQRHNKLLAFHEHKGTLHLFDINTSSIICTLPYIHDGLIYDMTFFETTKKSLFYGLDKKDSANDKCIALASCSRDCCVHVYAINWDNLSTATTSAAISNEQEKMITLLYKYQHDWEILKLAIIPNPNLLQIVMCCSRMDVRVWTPHVIAAGMDNCVQVHKTIGKRGQNRYCMTFQDDGNKLLVVTVDDVGQTEVIHLGVKSLTPKLIVPHKNRK